MRSTKPILLVEDDRVDAMTVRRALKEIRVTNELVIVGNGEEAIRWLHEHAHHEPCIIFLDLNMPKMNGVEFLHVIKQDPVLRRIPVVVLTTSKEERDRLETFNTGVAGYMIKPIDYIQFVDIMRTINMYWTISELPE